MNALLNKTHLGAHHLILTPIWKKGNPILVQNMLKSINRRITDS